MGLAAVFASENLAQRTVVVSTAAAAKHLECQFDTWQRDLAVHRDPTPLLAHQPADRR